MHDSSSCAYHYYRSQTVYCSALRSSELLVQMFEQLLQMAYESSEVCCFWIAGCRCLGRCSEWGGMGSNLAYSIWSSPFLTQASSPCGPCASWRPMAWTHSDSRGISLRPYILSCSIASLRFSYCFWLGTTPGQPDIYRTWTLQQSTQTLASSRHTSARWKWVQEWQIRSFSDLSISVLVCTYSLFRWVL